MASADVILVEPAGGVYDVCGKLWTVGGRYQVCEYIGGGSYGDVCRANDLELGIVVAIKRVGDILCSPVLAKRILREVCIMRRLSHPYIISLTDVFTQPSFETEAGLDLYIATEYADRGDMYHLRERLSPHEVKLLMWQLLVAVEYIHSVHVWHRDIKSENVLITTNASTMQVKLCDFGLSRSAMEGSSLQTEMTYNLGSVAAVQSRRKLVRQYTKTVVTPSYRAPEVIMSQGQYSSAIDMWSLGCIFWELLMRQLTPQRSGPPARPLFGVRGEPATPERGENYAEDGRSALAEQLDVIFNVIGTPCWKDIESVPSESWRSYLKHLPGRRGNLASQLAGSDEEGLDLLSRMLAFDPSRRCTAEEALSHNYFNSMKKHSGLPQVQPGRAPSLLPNEPFWTIRDPATALGVLERELELSVREKDGGQWKLVQLLRGEVEDQQAQQRFRLLQSKIAAGKVPLFAEVQNAMAVYQGAAFPPVMQAPVTMQLFPGSNVTLSEAGNHSNGPGGLLLPSQGAMEWQGQWLTREQPISKKETVQSKRPRKTISKQGPLRIEVNNPTTTNGANDVPSPTVGRFTRSTAAAAAVAAAGQPIQVNRATLPNVHTVAKTSQRRAPNRVMYNEGPALPRRSPRLRDLSTGDLPLRKRACLKTEAG